MKQYIDKAAVVAELEKRKKEAEYFFECVICNKILSFIDTLEVKEVDLEKEFDKCCENYIFDDECEVYTARHFFKLGLNAAKISES